MCSGKRKNTLDVIMKLYCCFKNRSFYFLRLFYVSFVLLFEGHDKG